jgi:hypothetical protein
VTSSWDLYAQARRLETDADAKARLAMHLRGEADAVEPMLTPVRVAMDGNVWRGPSFDRASTSCSENVGYLHTAADQLRLVAGDLDRQAGVLRQQADELRRQAAALTATEPKQPLIRLSGPS